MAFYSLIFIVLIDFLGLGRHLPVLNKLPIVISAILLVYVIRHYKFSDVFQHKQVKIYLVFFMLTCLSMFHSLVTLYAFEVVKHQLGYILLLLISYFILSDKRKIEKFFYIIVFIHIVVILENLNKITSGGRLENFNASPFLGDGNDLSWSLVTYFPFVFYLSTKFNGIKKIILLSLCGLPILSSIIMIQSRGATLALAAIALYSFLKTKKKTIYTIALVVAMFAVLTFAPSGYVDRIKTIKSYEQDSSALGRIMAWKASFRMATTELLGVGAGNFNSAYGRHYKPKTVDRRIYSGQRWISPHSIYFLVLGEYGFIGLALLLTLLYNNYKNNEETQKISRMFESDDDKEFVLLGYLLNCSLIAYAVGGMFLGGVNYPHLFILTFLSIKIKDMVYAKKAEIEGADA